MKESQMNNRKISFSGKKFKRSKCMRIHELLKATNSDENMVKILTKCAPVFSFTKVDDFTISFNLDHNGTTMGYQFPLNKEVERERRDGAKMKFYFTMEGENILHQIMKMPNGKYVYFTREFREKDAKMTVTIEGSDIEAEIYYDCVD